MLTIAETLTINPVVYLNKWLKVNVDKLFQEIMIVTSSD